MRPTWASSSGKASTGGHEGFVLMPSLLFTSISLGRSAAMHALG